MPRELELFLDENHHNSRHILSALIDSAVPVHRYAEHFQPQERDEVWLAFAAKQRWAVLTTDKRIRYRPLERQAVVEHGVALFCFTSNNMSGQKMADVLRVAIPEMRRVFRGYDAPFIASLSETGRVAVRETFRKR